MANCLMLLSKVGESCTNPSRERGLKRGGDFKCKTCKREFLSFQALGGHRASHKKIKLMGTHLSCRLPSPTMKKPKIKMHLCPICGLGFSIGQALGGHMRKHRASTKRFNLYLDLNLTPHENDLKLNLRTPVLDFFI